MSEPIARHQLFEYEENEPFLVINVWVTPGNSKLQNIDSHWHEELEVAYIIKGKSRHYIDGVCVKGNPGRLIVTNSGSTHNIVRDEECIDEPYIGAVVALIHAQFIKEHFPQYDRLYFTNERETASDEVREIMLRLSEYAMREVHNDYDALYAKGLILQLLYHMCEAGTAGRDMINVNEQKNIERLKGVLTYIENHYMEHLTQAELAERFYFSREYFSRYFKKCMGMTFTEYLMRYRLQRARRLLLESEKLVTEIALESGFSDDRRFINSFKKYYGITPLQYRKREKAN